MSLVGPQGLRQAAAASHNNTGALVNALSGVQGVSKLFDRPFFHEAVFQFDRPVSDILQALSEQGIVGGVALENYYPELGNSLLVCATETRSAEDIAQYVESIARIAEDLQATRRPAQPQMA